MEYDSCHEDDSEGDESGDDFFFSFTGLFSTPGGGYNNSSEYYGSYGEEGSESDEDGKNFPKIEGYNIGGGGIGRDIFCIDEFLDDDSSIVGTGFLLGFGDSNY